VIRLVERRRCRADQTDPFRDGSERRQQRERLELRDIAVCRAAQKVDVVAARARAVREKDQIELRGLGGLRKLDVVPEIAPRVDPRIRMPPCGDVMSRRIEKSAEAQMTLA